METISTLRYAGRAKSIQNRAHVNEEPKDALLRHFQEEIAELKKQLEEGAFEAGSGEEEEEEEDGEDDEEDEMITKEDNKAIADGPKKLKRRKSKVKNDAEVSFCWGFFFVFGCLKLCLFRLGNWENGRREGTTWEKSSGKRKGT